MGQIDLLGFYGSNRSIGFYLCVKLVCLKIAHI